MIQQIQKSIDFVENQLTANAKRALTTNLRIMIKLQSIYIHIEYITYIIHTFQVFATTLCSISTVCKNSEFKTNTPHFMLFTHSIKPFDF